MNQVPTNHPDASWIDSTISALVTYTDHPEWVAWPTSSVSGSGAIAAAEEAFGQLVGTQYAVLMPSATYGMRTALAAVGVGRGDEVIVPSFDWTANRDAVLSLNATPVPVAVRGETLTICDQAVQSHITPRTKAVIATHTHGVPADVPALARLGVPVLEDLSGAFGATLDGQLSGSMGTAGVLSLGPGKEIDCGEGAVLFTNDHAVWRRVIESATHPVRHTLNGLPPTGSPAFPVRVHPLTAVLALVRVHQWNLGQRRHDAAMALRAAQDAGLDTLTGGPERQLATPWIPVLTDSATIPGFVSRPSGAHTILGPEPADIQARLNVRLVHVAEEKGPGVFPKKWIAV